MGQRRNTVMTVEHGVFQQREHDDLKNQEIALNQLKEITGVQDAQALRHAYEASRGDINQAIVFLTDGSAAENAARQQPALPTPAAASVPRNQQLAIADTGTSTDKAPVYGPKNKGQDVIDLTHDRDEKDDLQRAIALSLRETAGPSTTIGVSTEEQDISRALEQSMAESKSGLRPGEVWFSDPLNPHDRCRNNGCPVGLKNVGNTCWFSAVIQSMFHLPAFRQMVLNFVPPANMQAHQAAASDTPANTPANAPASNTEFPAGQSEHRNLLFMTELRALFALMLGTKRKYVDPSKAVEILKGAFSTSGGANSQQDVSEFTHKLLEWLEDAFKSDCSRPPSPQAGEEEGVETPRRNPMLDLFYGQFKAEGINEGKVFMNQETFGQYPLQISGYEDLHESIEASMSHREIETVQHAKEKSAQEHWFTRLPHVLTFELSRFHFNQVIGRPEKIHNRFTFPQTLYMDRYMECNQAVTRVKRAEVHQIVLQLDVLQGRLERYLNYGSGPKRFPLQDVLQYALEFAHSTSPENSPPRRAVPLSLNNSNIQDVEMASPPRSLTGSPHSSGFSPDRKPHTSAPVQDVAMSSPSSVPHSPSTSTLPTANPSPKHITDTELDILQGCLRRWRTEVVSDVKDLQDKVTTLQNLKDNVYQDEHLRNHEYQLHAVLVHEGQASAGHYWAYVLDHQRNVWLKFNDISVTEVAWGDLERESVGGSGNTSAYCLMYVDAKRRDLFEEQEDDETGHSSLSLDPLADDLKQLVTDDNTRFELEIRQWDEAKEKRKTSRVANAATSTNEDKVVYLGESKALASGVKKNTPQPRPASPATVYPAERPLSAAVPDVSVPARGPSSYVAPSSVASPSAASLSLESISSEHDAEAALDQVCSEEVQRYRALLANEQCQLRDVRLESPVAYYLTNSAPRVLIRRAVLEQFAAEKGTNVDVRSQALRGIAQRKLDSQARSQQEQDIYSLWQEDYSVFCKANTYFIQGIQSYFQQEQYGYQEALPHFVHACNMNDKFIDEKAGKAMDFNMLAHFRRQCLLQLNAQCTNQFESAEVSEALQSLEIMNNLVVPCTGILTSSSTEEDGAAAEEIRGGWCNYLSREVSSDLHEKFQDFLSKLLDMSSEPTSIRAPPLVHTQKKENLSQMFTVAMGMIISNDQLSDTR
ncbi:ubiquitin carboxyl-terminal hydrolase 25-like isoform X2 [Patiria miniata]|uniref:ubiquitinyl hydrolase 1 n=1 Tax=Patiria miniata TaxID=46514 RepID=A0A914AP99_PATMI|nr:ubiquitin carboxyl-terminal hydrolase 25-like isoform X2 [Patiria miniata]